MPSKRAARPSGGRAEMATALLAVADPVETVMEWMRERFDAAAARELCAVFEFRLEGDAGGAFAMRVANGTASFERSGCARSDVRYRASLDDWLAVLDGRESPDLLYLAGHLEIEGDLALAVKLRCLFRRLV